MESTAPPPEVTVQVISTPGTATLLESFAWTFKEVGIDFPISHGFALVQLLVATRVATGLAVAVAENVAVFEPVAADEVTVAYWVPGDEPRVQLAKTCPEEFVVMSLLVKEPP